MWIHLGEHVALVRLVCELVERQVVDHVFHFPRALAVAPLPAAAWELLRPSACSLVLSVLPMLSHVQAQASAFPGSIAGVKEALCRITHQQGTEGRSAANLSTQAEEHRCPSTSTG